MGGSRANHKPSQRPGGFTVKQERFCVSYHQHGNATRAAKEAGYSPHTASAIGHDLLRETKIQARLSEFRDEAFRKVHMTKDELLGILARQARAQLGNVIFTTAEGDPYIDLSKAGENEMAALTEATIEDFVDSRERDDEGKPIKRDVRRVKVSMKNNIKAAELLLRAMGLVSGSGPAATDERSGFKVPIYHSPSSGGDDD